MRTEGRYGAARACAALIAGIALVGVTTVAVIPTLAAEAVTGCAEPTYLVVEMSTVGDPISYSETFGCLPGGDTFSGAVIQWGDGSTSPGTLTPGTSSESYSSVTVAGQHTYTTAGSYDVSIEVTDDRTGQVYERTGHKQLSISAPSVHPGGASPTQPQPAPQPAPVTPTNSAPSTRLTSRRVLAWRGVARLETVAYVSTELPGASLHASIRWGDGTSSRGVVTRAGAEFTVRGRHRWRRSGRYPITVTVADASGRVLARTVSHALVSARA